MLGASVIDLLILTALTEEAQVVTAVLDQVATKVEGDGQVRLYDYSAGAGRSYRIGAVSAHQMGAVGMGVFAAPLLKNLRPRSAALVGIAAARPSRSAAQPGSQSELRLTGQGNLVAAHYSGDRP